MFLLHRSVTLRGVTRYTVMFCRCPPFAVGTGLGPGGSVGAVARVRPGVDACWRLREGGTSHAPMMLTYRMAAYGRTWC